MIGLVPNKFIILFEIIKLQRKHLRLKSTFFEKKRFGSMLGYEAMVDGFGSNHFALSLPSIVCNRF